MAQSSDSSVGVTDPEDNTPNMIVYRKIEDIITRMQDDKAGGVPIRTVKSFLSKIPSVVTGADIVQWLIKNLIIEDPVEAIHLGSLIAAQGYIFPISDHVLTLKDDGTFYRFQAPYFWPSNCWEPENTDYAIYLCKRTMQNKARLELADYEAENLARLQRAFARKWEFIFMQAEAQVKIDRKKDKTERKILDSQERGFWDVHRPVPGCVNTTEMDIRKCRRMKNPQKVKKSVYGVSEDSQSQSPVHMASHVIRKTTKDDLRKQIHFLNVQIDRHCLKMSKVADSFIAYSEQYNEYDPFLTPAEPSNPWISDDSIFWDLEISKEPSQQRVKRWGFSLDEVLKDPVGREQLLRFLESEFSSENLRFWVVVQDLKKQPLQEVPKRVEEIWQEFLAPGAQSAINLDSHSFEKTSQNVKDAGRYTFEDAQEHIYKLMKSDSYARYLRSNAYQDLLSMKKKTENEQGRRTSLEKFTRSVGKSLTSKRLTGLMQSS
ncbi:regulator of G-protein signaling 6 isoform X1 [Rana temporaria]|uniref:regulator of G-protein signaling 6 isoform X1 n=1 Tax=Rana temporaria TaxID=8407 RepID=UPI001AADD926|nr:regulator of G-protein signaling 6 isoform X1 [Rana temporaria]